MITQNLNVKNIDKNDPVSNYDAFVAVDTEGSILALYVYMSRAYLHIEETTRYFYTAFLANGKVEPFYVDGKSDFFFEFGDDDIMLREVKRDIHADIIFDYNYEQCRYYF